MAKVCVPMFRFLPIALLLFAALSGADQAQNGGVSGRQNQSTIGVEPEVIVKGLFRTMAVLEIDGTQHTLRIGNTSPEGVTLISADPKRGAEIEISGTRKVIELSKKIGGVTFKAPEKSVARISRGVGGHYFTPGRINNRPAQFVVDTGATAVAMNSIAANRLGIDYKRGRVVQVSTAGGITQGYVVNLSSVSVGNVTVNNVRAIVQEGAFPEEILLGNTYLQRVEFKIERGILILQSRF